MWVNWHKTEGRTWVTVFVTDSLKANPLRWSGGFLSRNPFKLCPVKLSSLCCFLHSAFNTSSWQLKNAALFRHLLTFLSLLISLHEWMTLHMGGYVFDDCIHHSLCVCVCLRISSISGLKKMESSRVNLALLSFPQHFFMCNYIPPLIENRTLPKFSHNKELLFPRCAYVRVRVCVWVCVCGNNCLLSVSISTHLVIKVDIIWEVDYRLIVLMFL